jgi:CBS domain-containing protein
MMKSELTAKDVMTAELITVAADLTVAEVVELLTENEVSGAPVVDEEGMPIGVVSLSDVARRATGRGPVDLDRSRPEFYLRGWEDRYALEEVRALRIVAESLSVRDVMTETLFTVGEDAPLDEIAGVMLGAHVHRVLVTRDGRLAGIVSSLDLLGALFA